MRLKLGPGLRARAQARSTSNFISNSKHCQRRWRLLLGTWKSKCAKEVRSRRPQSNWSVLWVVVFKKSIIFMVIFLIVGSNRGSVSFFSFCFHDESRNKEPKLRKVVETKKSNQGGFESFWRQTNTREEPNNEEKRETRPRPEFFFSGPVRSRCRRRCRRCRRRRRKKKKKEEVMAGEKVSPVPLWRSCWLNSKEGSEKDKPMLDPIL